MERPNAAVLPHDIVGRSWAFVRREWKGPHHLEAMAAFFAVHWFEVGTDHGERALRDLAKDLALAEAKVAAR